MEVNKYFRKYLRIIEELRHPQTQGRKERKEEGRGQERRVEGRGRRGRGGEGAYRINWLLGASALEAHILCEAHTFFLFFHHFC